MFDKKKSWCMALNLKSGAGYLRYCDMTNRQMAFHMPEKNIQLVQSAISKVDGVYPAKWSAKLPKFCFHCMYIFHHKFNDINSLAGSIFKKVLPSQFKFSRNLDGVSVFITRLLFFTVVFFNSFICKKNAEIV